MKNAQRTNSVNVPSNFNLGRKLLASTAMTAAGLMAFSGQAQAANDWTDHVATSGGSISIDTATPNTTNITQTGARVTVSGDGDIKLGHTVNLSQDTTSSQYILFDVEGDATKIHGTLNANGEVFIFDTDGVVFGANAVVDVGSIVASTAGTFATVIDGDDQTHVFTNFGDGEIINRGSITVAEAGLAAFVSPNVTNTGVINARMGTVVMAAGQTVTLDMYGDGLVEVAVNGELADGLIESSGNIKAHGGNVLVSAAVAKDAVDNVINMSGVTTVSSAVVKGGKIILSGGESGRVNVNGALNANGVGGQDAGEISLTGERVRVGSTGRVRANAQADGAAGDIEVIADRTIIIDGKISAQGLAGTGFIETSAPIALFGGTASILATREWLLDPTNITIDMPLAALLNAQLDVGDMTVQTNAGGVGAGNIVLNNGVGILKTSSSDSTFTLNAHNDITINGTIGSTGTGALNVDLNADFDQSGGDADVLVRGNISTGGGAFTATASDDIDVKNGAIVNTDGGDITIASRGLGDGSWLWMPNGGAGTGRLSSNDGDITITVDNIKLADGSSIDADDGAVNISRDVAGTIGLGAASGDMELTQDEIARIDAGTLTIGGANTTGIDVNGVDTTSATIAGLVTLNALGAGGDVNFDGANTFAALSAEADDDIHVRAGSSITTTTGGVSLTANNSSGGGNTVNQIEGIIDTTAAGADGDVDLAATDYFVEVDSTGKILTDGGKLTVTSNHGFDIDNGAMVMLGAGGAHIDAPKVQLGDDIDTTGAITGTASTVNVENDDAQIQDGVDVAANGATVNVAAGTYNESVNLYKEGLILLGNNAGTDGHLHANPKTIVSPNSPGFYVTADNVEINGFTIVGGSTGVFVDGGDNATVVNNEIYGQLGPDGPGLGDGIFMDGSFSSQVLNNYVHDVEDDGIQGDNSSSMTVYNNVLEDIGKVGIALIRNSDNQDIQNNIITNTGRFGIRSSGGGSVTIEGNTLTNTATVTDAFANDAIRVDKRLGSGFTSGSISGNTIDGTQESGIELEDIDTGLTIADNIISDAEIGIYNNGSDGTTIDNNTISDVDTGVLVNPSANVFVENNDIYGGAFGVKVENSNDVWVRNNDIDDAATGIYGDNAEDIKVSDNDVAGATFRGINIRNSDGTGYGGSGNDVDIWGNNVTGLAAGAIGINVFNSDYATIGWHPTNPFANAATGGNTITGGIRGILVSGSDNTYVAHNDVSDVSSVGIFMNNGNDSTILGNTLLNNVNNIYVNLGDNHNVASNTIDGGARGIWFNETGDNNTADDNTIGATTGVSDVAIRSRLATGSTFITNNHIFNTGWDGVQVLGGTGFMTITGNEIGNTTGASSIALLDHLGGGLIDNNDIDGADRMGIYSQYSDNYTISNNTVTDTGREGVNWWTSGIHLEGSNNTTIDSNTVTNTNNGGDGIQIGGAGNRPAVTTNGNVVSNNDVNNASGDGVHVEDSNGVIIGNNDVFATAGGAFGSPPSATNGADRHGIFVSGGQDAVINNNRIKGDAGFFAFTGLGAVMDGIHVEDNDGVEITNNSITGDIGLPPVGATGANGIYVTDSSEAFVDTNTVIGVGENGIYVEDSDDSDVSNNTVSLTGSNGIYVSSSDDTDITDNNVSLTGGHGVKVNPSDRVEIADNVITFTGEDGINVQDGFNIRIKRNDISHISGDGIDVDGNNRVRIRRNTISHVDENGIEVSDSEGDVNNGNVIIKGNEITNVGRDGEEGDDANGIYLEGVETAHITENTIRVTGWDGIRLEDFGSAWVSYNDIKWTTDDGIDASDGDFISIYDNYVDLAGFLPSFPFGNEKVGDDADGIVVEDVSGELPPLADAEEGFGTSKYGANVEIYGNDVANTEDDGIQIIGDNDDESAYIANNLIGHVGDDGVDVNNVDHTVVKDNIITLAEDAGITVRDGEYAGIFDNRILLTGTDGIRVHDIDGNGVEAVELLGDEEYGYGWSVNVSGNEVAFTGQDGIHVGDSGATIIRRNNVFAAGLGEELEEVIEFVNEFANGTFSPFITVAAPSVESIVSGFSWEWGDGHGIVAHNIEGAYWSPNGWAVDIRGNNVKYTGGHGILAEESDRTRIANNRIRYSGIDEVYFSGAPSMASALSSGPFEGEGRRDLWRSEGLGLVEVMEDFVGVEDPEEPTYNDYIFMTEFEYDNHDAIHADDIYGEYEDGLSGRPYLYDLKIKGNNIRFTGDDGIEVDDAGRTLIAENRIRDAGHGDDEDYGAGGYDGADGIHVSGVSTEFYDGFDIPTITALSGLDEESEGYDYERPRNYALIIRNNDIRRTADDGIEVVGTERRRLATRTGGIGEPETGYYYGTTDRVLIAENTIRRTGDDVDSFDYEENIGPDGYGRDGIHVRNVGGDIIEGVIYGDVEPIGAGSGYAGETGPGGFYGYAVDVIGNDVRRTGDDGIEVIQSTSTLIYDNRVRNAGIGGGYDYGSGDYYGADGIHVRNVGGGGIIWAPGASGAGDSGVDFKPYAVAIAENDVRRTADDGIEVVGEGGLIGDGCGDGSPCGDGSCVADGDGWSGDGLPFGGTGRTLISNNLVRDAGYFDVEFVGEGAQSVYVGGDRDGYGADGIHVRGVQNNFFVTMAGAPDSGSASGSGSPYYEGYDIEIVGNDVKNVNDDGIEVIGTKAPDYYFAPELNILVDSNDVENSGDNGINIFAFSPFMSAPEISEGPAVALIGSSSINSVVSNNTVINSENNALYIEGGAHGEVEVSGNTFEDFDIGANFESGEIDLTGDGNSFIGGRVGMRFAPAEVSGVPFDIAAIEAEAIEPIFAPMSLVDNTIGAQTFDGQSESYVELENGAFFNPGTPTLLNALDSTYVGTSFGTFTPSVDYAAGFPVDVVAYLETMFVHFNDNGNTGLFFFPLLPEIDQEDILNYFGPYADGLSGLQVTILGLPTIPGGAPIALNNITPAAGGDPTSPEALNAIETASGGEEKSCFDGSALSAAGSGQPVNISYGGSAEDLLNSEASCGS